MPKEKEFEIEIENDLDVLEDIREQKDMGEQNISIERLALEADVALIR